MQKTIISILPLALLIGGYQTTQAQSPNNNKMTTEQNKQVVIKFNKEFFESGNTAITKELLATTFVNHTAPPNAPTDASVMIQFITGFHKGFSGVSVQIHEVLAEDDKVSLR